MEFYFLNNEGKDIFFDKFFNNKLNNEESERLHNIKYLTPGDFRTVRQSLFYLAENVSNAERLELLEKESIIKKSYLTDNAGNVKIGFGI
jgi:hypothetical protein